MAIEKFTTRQREQLNFGGLKDAKLNEKIDELIDELNARPVQAVVAGTNGTEIASPSDIGTVISVQAFVTSSGAAAAKALLAPTTDYTVANGKLTCVSNQSANTLVVTYRKK